MGSGDIKNGADESLEGLSKARGNEMLRQTRHINLSWAVVSKM